MSGLTVILAGNPNTGKSTLFNALTGARQRVGNWPGVTVEQRTGEFTEQNTIVTVVDLPGIYALEDDESAASADEKIAADCLRASTADCVITVLDALHLERSLYLTVQLLEQGVPVLVVVNRMDLAASHGLEINCEQLAEALGCPVVPMSVRQRKGIADLKKSIFFLRSVNNSEKVKFQTPSLIGGWGNKPSDSAASHSPTHALPQKGREEIASECDADILRADARYRFIHDITQRCVRQVSRDRSLTRAIDRIVLNRFLGIPIFLAVMYALFFFSLGVGGIFQDFFDIAGETVFVGGAAQLMTALGVPAWVVSLLAEGAGKGIHTTLTFVPVLAAMFFLLALLEDSGYMARAAFVVDRLMRMLGLPGKSLVPLIVGVGCNVPAVMAARTLENERDRILTVMMTPFVPCGARLAIFAVFVAAFFPAGGASVVFCLYLTGIVMAVLTGFLLRQTALSGAPSPLVMELPEWLMPDLKTLLIHTWQRLQGFVIRAGRLIVPVCILIALLNTLSLGDRGSLLAIIGQWLTPVFAPMGLSADNWPATVGLVTGVLAKEVVIGTLNTLYSQSAHLVSQVKPFDFWAGLQAAWDSIPAHVTALMGTFSNPVLAAAPIQSLPQPVYGVMAERFQGVTGAFAYLLFVLLYFPCVSTLAVMWREIGRRWTLFSMFWSMGVAYVVAVLFYQVAQLTTQPVISMSWVGAIGVGGLLIWMVFRRSMRGVQA